MYKQFLNLFNVTFVRSWIIVILGIFPFASSQASSKDPSIIHESVMGDRLRLVVTMKENPLDAKRNHCMIMMLEVEVDNPSYVRMFWVPSSDNYMVNIGERYQIDDYSPVLAGKYPVDSKEPKYFLDQILGGKKISFKSPSGRTSMYYLKDAVSAVSAYRRCVVSIK